MFRLVDIRAFKDDYVRYMNRGSFCIKHDYLRHKKMLWWAKEGSEADARSQMNAISHLQFLSFFRTLIQRVKHEG